METNGYVTFGERQGALRSEWKWWMANENCDSVNFNQRWQQDQLQINYDIIS